MRTSNLSKRRLKRIVNCFASGLTAIDTSYKLKLHRNTVNKYYRQIREAIADYETEVKKQLPLPADMSMSFNLLWHKNKGLCLYAEDADAADLLSFILFTNQNQVFVYEQEEFPAQKVATISEVEDTITSRFYHYAKEKLTRFYGVKPEYTYLYLQELEFRFNNTEANLVNLILKIIEPGKGGRKAVTDDFSADNVAEEA